MALEPLRQGLSGGEDLIQSDDLWAPQPELRRTIPCPVCGFPIGAVRGSKAAICTNCGFKDGCC